MKKDTHKNSKIVMVTRLSSQYQNAQDKEIGNDIMTNAKTNLVAPLKREGGGAINIGITPKERDMIMPEILGLDTEDRGYIKEVQNYFKEYAIRLGTKPIKLEVGVEDDGRPLNSSDYLKYKVIQAIPQIANEDESPNALVHQYKIVYAKQTREKRAQETKNKMQAINEFNKLANQEYRKYLTLIGLEKNQPKAVNTLTDEEVLTNLFEQVSESPDVFLKVHNDKDAQDKYFIESLITHNILKRVGGVVMYENMNIGTMQKALGYLREPGNNETVLVWKVKLQELSTTYHEEFIDEEEKTEQEAAKPKRKTSRTTKSKK